MRVDSRGSSKNVGPGVTNITAGAGDAARASRRSYAHQKNTARVIMDLLLQGARFEREIAAMTGISLRSVRENLASLMAKPGSPLRCERVNAPAAMRTAGAKLAVRYSRTDAGPAARGPIEQAAMKPLQGSGLMGRPIVLRPGSDWALRTDALVTLGGPMGARCE